LLPLPFGKKGPDWSDWQSTTFERTQEPDYQAGLNAAKQRKGNIGVLLIERLVAIDIDSDEFVDGFLALNPALSETLRSKGVRGCQLWLRMVRDYPEKIFKLRKRDGTSWGEWRGGGGAQSVIAGQHPSGSRYQRIVAKPVIEIAFDDIVWPADVVLPWNEKKTQPEAESSQPEGSDLAKRISAYVDAIPGAVSGHNGHDQTYKTACQLINGWGLSAAEAMPYLQAYNLRCEPPWNDKELAHKLADAEKVQHDKPRGHLVNDNRYEEPSTVEPSPADIAKKLDIFYDSNRTTFWVKNDRGGWMIVTTSDVRRRLKEQGFRSLKRDNERVSQVDAILTAIQQSNDVDYADSLAGYNAGVYLIKGKRILVRDSPTLIQPVEAEWQNLSLIFQRMLGSDQKTYLFGWLKVAVESLYSSKPRVGQALVLAGPPDGGKSLTQHIITLLIGGRPGKPHRYMSGLTPFNSELMGYEHLMIEDEESSTDIRARRNFGSKVKEICANEEQSCHAKFRAAITLTPFWRLSISVNSEPENLMILPPIDEHLQDKFIILKCEKHPMPMPTVTNEQREAFMNTLKAELPHFLAFLFRWQIPDNLKSGRYGITHFQHPDILQTLTTLAPETRLLELIDSELFDSPAPGAWEGSANQLERKLTSEGSGVRREAERLLTFPLACATYLGRLQKRDHDRFQVDHTRKGNLWTINPP
jgi:hypothetical protein